MASQAQTSANRRNSKKSTGPKTPEGKQIVSQNAVKHGLFAHEAVIHGEDPAEFELHREALLAEWRPVGPTESLLAERIVSLSWRLRRAELMQNQAMDCMILRAVVGSTDSQLDRSYSKAYGVSPGDPGVSTEYLPLGRIATRLCSDNPHLIERLFMHERRIESSLHRTIIKLKKLQVVRRIEREDAAKRSAARTPAAQNNVGDFAKQSQFPPGLADVTPFIEKHYEYMTQSGTARNKANQSRPSKKKRHRSPVKREIARAVRGGR